MTEAALPKAADTRNGEMPCLATQSNWATQAASVCGLPKGHEGNHFSLGREWFRQVPVRALDIPKEN